MAKEIFVAYGVDVDAVAGWLGSYGGENWPDDISRGLFAGEVGTPRLLELFRRHDLKTTWFIPGHSIETFPAETEQVVAAGHEVGIHGYSHENPIAMTREQETAVLDKCIDLVERVSGRRPTGYVAPWWEFSNVTNELLLERGIKYDHSLMHKDFEPYYVRVGDSWTKIGVIDRHSSPPLIAWMPSETPIPFGSIVHWLKWSHPYTSTPPNRAASQCARNAVTHTIWNVEVPMTMRVGMRSR